MADRIIEMYVTWSKARSTEHFIDAGAKILLEWLKTHLQRSPYIMHPLSPGSFILYGALESTMEQTADNGLAFCTLGMLIIGKVSIADVARYES